MSISKNARCSQIMHDMTRGKFVKDNKFRHYGETEVDRPSWDFRPIKLPAVVSGKLLNKKG